MSSIVEELLPNQVMPCRVTREPYLAERVVMIGGQPGCGKSLMPSIVGSFHRVEIPTYDYPLEYFCGLHFLGRLDEDVIMAMIRMLTDLDLYHVAQGRCVNFRWTDFTSVFRNTGTWRYLRRIFQAGDAAAVERIRQIHPILQLTIHNVMLFMPAWFRALGDRLRIVELVRHPLYMVKQGEIYFRMFGTDVREFSLWIEWQGQALPFFAHGWEAQYAQANAMDRVIYTIDRLTAQRDAFIQQLSDRQRAQILTVPFEPFVLEPWPYLKRLETLMGTAMTAQTHRHLRRQRVPRKRIADGAPLKVYRAYGWEPPQQGLDEQKELEKRRSHAATLASAEGMKVLDRLSAEYEATYWKPV